MSLTFRSAPLVRCKNTLYYGYSSEDYVVKLDVKSSNKLNELDVASKVSVHLMRTDPSAGVRDRIIKSSEKLGLYAAIDIAEAWLSKAIAKDE